jgi:hypothetical protein
VAASKTEAASNELARAFMAHLCASPKENRNPLLGFSMGLKTPGKRL